jgi:hypothetical protein
MPIVTLSAGYVLVGTIIGECAVWNKGKRPRGRRQRGLEHYAGCCINPNTAIFSD